MIEPPWRPPVFFMSANFEFDQLVVFGPERQSPDLLAGGLAGLEQAAGELVVVREHARILLRERDQYRAREGREIDHELRLEAVLDVPEHVSEHQAAFGVRVDDLDRLTGHRGDDVAGPLGFAVRHVLDQPDRSNDVRLRLARGERVHQPDDAGGAGHIPFHVLHAAAGLDRDAAGIEHHAFADEGDGLGARPAAVPAHDDHPALALGALAHREERPHAELPHRLLIEDLDLDSELRQLLGALGELLRPEHVRRLVDEIAGDAHALGETVGSLRGFAGDGGIRTREGDLGRRVVLVVVLLLGLVAIELVKPEPRPECYLRNVVGGRRRALQVKEDGAASSRELACDDAAELDPIELRAVALAADADGDEAVGVQSGRRRNDERRVSLPLEALGRCGLGYQLAGLAQELGDPRARLEILPDEHDDVAARGGAQGLEVDLHARCHRDLSIAGAGTG